jgi:hypothetical protein
MTQYYAPAGGQAAANTIVSGVQAGPRAAELSSGHVVVWEDRSASPDDSSFAIRGQLFDTAGNKSGAEFLVNTVTAGNQTAPSVAALTTGGFVVAWTGTDSSGTGVKAQLFTAAGAKSGSEFQVNSGTSENQMGAQAVSVPGLGFAIVWLDYSGTGNAIRGQYYRTDGTAYGSQFTVSSSATEVHSDLAVAAVGDGNSRIAVSWTQANGDSSGSAAMARVIRADGTAVGGAFALGQATAGDQRDSALALHAPSKGFVAVYVDEGEGGAVKLRRFSPEGVALGGDLRLTAAGERGDSPSIIAFASGMLAVSWIDGGGNQRVQMVNPTGDALGEGLVLGASAERAALVALGSESFLAAWSDGDIQTRAFAPAGPAVSDIAISDTLLSEAIPANLAVAQLATSGIGGSSGFTYSLVSDSTGGAFLLQGDRLVLADPSRIDFETAPTVEVTVRATDSQGLDREETYVLAVSDAPEAAPGWTVSAPFAPNDAAWGPTIPKLASLASGGFVMVYFDSRFSSATSGESPVRGRLYSASGEAVGGEIKVPITQDGNQHPVDVTGLAGGGFAVMFSDYREGTGNTGAQLRVQLFDSHGTAVSGQIKVATTSAGGQSGTLAALPNGGFVVTFANGWSGSVPTVSNVKAQIFDSTGNKVGGEMVVPSNSGWPQADPAVAVLADGGFLIAWTDRSNASIDAQRFDAAGARVGASFRVSSSGQLHYDPSVAGLAGGGFVVTWNHGSGFGVPTPNPWDVIGQVFDAAGNKIGGEFLVNADPAGGERFGVVVALLDGGFLVTWNEFPSSGDNYFGGVTRGQRFDASGQKVGGEFALDEGFSSGQFYTAAAALPWGGVVIAHAESGPTTPGASLNVEARLLSPGTFVAADDQLRITESGGWIGNLLHDNGGGADSAPQGGKLIVSALNGSSDAVGKTITLPSGALLKLNSDGTFDYDPNHAFDALAAHDSGGSNAMGHDSFTYAIGGGNTATVDVTVFGEYSDPHIVLGTSGADNLTGSGLADRLRLDSGGDDVAFAGAGQDGVFFGAALTSADQADGGADRDQLTIQGDYKTVALTLGAGIVNFESFTLLSGTDTRYGDSGTHSYSYDITSRDENIAAGQLLVVDGAQLKAGEDFTFDGSAETDGAFRLWGGFGVEDLTGGALSDQFYFSFGRFGADDKVDGGASRDQLGLRGDYSIVFGADQVTSIESMVLLSGRGVSDDTDYDYDLRTHDLNLAQGVQMTVDGGQLGAAEELVFDGSAELDGTFRIFGGAGADSLTGGAGSDMLLGAAGKDYLKGGGGADVYSYRGASDSTSTGYDTIDGFEFGSDTLDLPGDHDDCGRIGGALSLASFDSDMAAAMAGLSAGHASFLEVTAGDLAGHLFLVVDQNGIAGYQAGEDFVIEFVNSIVPAAIPDFIV